MESYDELITIVSEKMEEHKDDNSFGVFNKIDKELNARSGTAFDANYTTLGISETSQSA